MYPRLHISFISFHTDLADRSHESSSANVSHESACANVAQESSRVQNEQPIKFPEETRTPTDRKRQSNGNKSSKMDSSKQGDIL